MSNVTQLLALSEHPEPHPKCANYSSAKLVLKTAHYLETLCWNLGDGFIMSEKLIKEYIECSDKL